MKTSDGYSKTQIALHWGIVVLIAVNYIVSDGMGRAMRAMLRGENVTGLTPAVHVYVGLAVLALVALRLVIRLWRGAPAPVGHGPEILEKMGEAAHWLLYFLLFAVPVLGALAWYGGIASLGDVHVIAMNIMLAVAGVHALAALYHHYVLRDEVLTRMLRPGGRPQS